ncbi:MAG: hypothetical protein HS104_05205 [Polyangiaceae bacterium]|nr:hypothetical protein [Polyangiaceae bacterium]
MLTLRVAAAFSTEPFALDVDSTDRDGDGRDDVRLVVTQKPPCRTDPALVAQGCPTDKEDKSVSAQVVWIDRAAGLSRDATEPAASLGALAAAELGRSKRKQTAASVPRGVAQLRRLLGTLCAEGAASRLFEADGSMLRCEPLGTVVERLLVAEVQAALTEKDVERALAALDRDGWYFGRVPDKRRAELVKSVSADTTSVEPKVTKLAVSPLPRGNAPRPQPVGIRELRRAPGSDQRRPVTHRRAGLPSPWSPTPTSALGPSPSRLAAASAWRTWSSRAIARTST